MASGGADIGSKRLIGLDLQGWSAWVTPLPQVRAIEMISSQLQWVAREGDILVRAYSPEVGEFLILNEIQLRYNAKVPRRIRAYAALAEEKYQLPVYPVLINILPSATIAPRYESQLGRINATQDYDVINLWEVDVRIVFSRPLPTLLPFVPILRGGGEERIVREALRELRSRPELVELEPLLAFFAGFVLRSQVVQQIMRWDMAVLRESPWYQEILQEGKQLGIEEGKQLGIEEGKQLGIEEGKQLGIEEGKQLGIEEGKQKSLREVALNLLRQGMSVELVAGVTGLSRDRISELQSGL